MKNLLEQIIEGKSEEESTADLLTLCFIGAQALMEKRATMRELDTGKIESVDKCFAEDMENIGKIFCPLYDNVKQENKDYTSKMLDIRLSFRGISSSSEKQTQLRGIINKLASENMLDSIQTAIDNKIYRMFVRAQNMTR